MKRTTKYTSFAVGAALTCALALTALPAPALAMDTAPVLEATALQAVAAARADAHETAGEGAPVATTTQAEAKVSAATAAAGTIAHTPKAPSSLLALVQKVQATQADFTASVEEAAAQLVEAGSATDKLLEYDPALLAEIGTQESTGHTICCSSFSCAYADAVLDGTVHDHSYYTCGNCTWTDWGGGDSWNRDLGSDQALLREAYDEIAAGRPTVVHVAASYGEHWITLIGYQNVADPDDLTLDNFIALDPWDGAQLTASDHFSLYGDNCQHVSER